MSTPSDNLGFLRRRSANAPTDIEVVDPIEGDWLKQTVRSHVGGTYNDLVGLRSLGNKLVGDDEESMELAQQYAAEDERLRARGPDIQSFEDAEAAGGGIGNYGAALAYQGVGLLPDLAMMATGAGAGGVVGRQAAKRMVRSDARNLMEAEAASAAKLAAREAAGTAASREGAVSAAAKVAQTQADKFAADDALEEAVKLAGRTPRAREMMAEGGKWGARIGGAAGSFPGISAENTMDALADPNTSREDAWALTAGSTAAAATSIIPMERWLGRLGPQAKAAIGKQAQGFMARHAANVAKGMAVQGAEEGIQEAGQQALMNASHAYVSQSWDPLWSEKAVGEYISSAIVGGVLGGAMGAAGPVAGAGIDATSGAFRLGMRGVRKVRDVAKNAISSFANRARAAEADGSATKPRRGQEIDLDGNPIEPSVSERMSSKESGLELDQSFEERADAVARYVNEMVKKFDEGEDFMSQPLRAANANPMDFGTRTRNVLMAHIPENHPIFQDAEWAQETSEILENILEGGPVFKTTQRNLAELVNTGALPQHVVDTWVTFGKLRGDNLAAANDQTRPMEAEAKAAADEARARRQYETGAASAAELQGAVNNDPRAVLDESASMDGGAEFESNNPDDGFQRGDALELSEIDQINSLRATRARLVAEGGTQEDLDAVDAETNALQEKFINGAFGKVWKRLRPADRAKRAEIEQEFDRRASEDPGYVELEAMGRVEEKGRPNGRAVRQLLDLGTIATRSRNRMRAEGSAHDDIDLKHALFNGIAELMQAGVGLKAETFNEGRVMSKDNRVLFTLTPSDVLSLREMNTKAKAAGAGQPGVEIKDQWVHNAPGLADPKRAGEVSEQLAAGAEEIKARRKSDEIVGDDGEAMDDPYLSRAAYDPREDPSLEREAGNGDFDDSTEQTAGSNMQALEPPPGEEARMGRHYDAVTGKEIAGDAGSFVSSLGGVSSVSTHSPFGHIVQRVQAQTGAVTTKTNKSQVRIAEIRGLLKRRPKTAFQAHQWFVAAGRSRVDYASGAEGAEAAAEYQRQLDEDVAELGELRKAQRRHTANGDRDAYEGTLEYEERLERNLAALQQKIAAAESAETPVAVTTPAGTKPTKGKFVPSKGNWNADLDKKAAALRTELKALESGEKQLAVSTSTQRATPRQSRALRLEAGREIGVALAAKLPSARSQALELKRLENDEAYALSFYTKAERGDYDSGSAREQPFDHMRPAKGGDGDRTINDAEEYPRYKHKESQERVQKTARGVGVGFKERGGKMTPREENEAFPDSKYTKARRLKDVGKEPVRGKPETTARREAALDAEATRLTNELGINKKSKPEKWQAAWKKTRAALVAGGQGDAGVLLPPGAAREQRAGDGAGRNLSDAEWVNTHITNRDESRYSGNATTAKPEAPKPATGKRVVKKGGAKGAIEFDKDEKRGPKLTTKSAYGAKDQRKADRANKFIGEGSAQSSTAQYAKDYGRNANSGKYSAGDVVFVSAEGKRKGRKNPPWAELKRAMSAGATIITDGAKDRARDYNVGERQVAEFLAKEGYVETKDGVWAPAGAKTARGKAPEAPAADFSARMEQLRSKMAKHEPARDNDLSAETAYAAELLDGMGLGGDVSVVEDGATAAGHMGAARAYSNTVYLGPDLKGGERIEVLNHEIGHIAIARYIAKKLGVKVGDLVDAKGQPLRGEAWMESLKAADPQLYAALRADFDAYRRNANRLGTAAEARAGRTPYLRLQGIDGRGSAPFQSLSKNDQRYVMSMNEWMADNIARALATNKKAQTISEKFFADLAAFIKKVYNHLFAQHDAAKWGPAPSVEAFVQGLFDGDAQAVKAATGKATSPKKAKKIVKGAVAAATVAQAAPVGAPADAVASPVFSPSEADARKQAGLDALRRVMEGGEDVNEALFNDMATVVTHVLRPQEREILTRVLSRHDNVLALRDFANALGSPELLKKLDDASTSMEWRISLAYYAWKLGLLDKPGANTRNTFFSMQDDIFRLVNAAGAGDMAQRIFTDIGNGVIATMHEQNRHYNVRQLEAQARGTMQKVLNWMAEEGPISNAFARFWSGQYARMRDSGIPAMRALAAQLQRPQGTTGEDMGLIPELRNELYRYHSKFSKAFKGASPEDTAAALRVLQMGVPSGGAEFNALSDGAKEVVQKARAVFNEMARDIESVDPPNEDGSRKVGYRANYFPVIMDMRNSDALQRLAAIYRKPQYKAEVFKLFGTKEEDQTDEMHEQLVQKMANAAAYEPEAKDPLASLDAKAATGSRHTHRRFSKMLYDYAESNGDYSDLSLFAELQTKNVDEVFARYFNPTVKMVVARRRFGMEEDAGEYTRFNARAKLDNLIKEAKAQGATDDDVKLMENAVKAALGTYGADVSPTIAAVSPALAKKLSGAKTRSTIQGLQAYQNLRLLPLALLSSMTDHLGVAVRTGGDFTTAWRGMKKGFASITNKEALEEGLALLEELQMVDDFMPAIASHPMFEDGENAFARKVSEQVFKWNGMSTWVRATRIMAAHAGKAFLLKHAGGADGDTSTRYLNELGLDATDVQVDADGQLVMNDKVKQALAQFVDEAILRPNSMQAPLWHRDPYMGLITQYKAFGYAMFDQISGRTWREINHGNYRVVLAAMAYLPLALMAELLREFIQYLGQGNPNRKDWNAADYGAMAAMRTGMFGPKIEIASDVKGDLQRQRLPGSSQVGPSVKQAGDFADAARGRRDGSKTIENALPAAPAYQNWNNLGESEEPKQMPRRAA